MDASCAPTEGTVFRSANRSASSRPSLPRRDPTGTIAGSAVGWDFQLSAAAAYRGGSFAWLVVPGKSANRTTAPPRTGSRASRHRYAGVSCPTPCGAQADNAGPGSRLLWLAEVGPRARGARPRRPAIEGRCEVAGPRCDHAAAAQWRRHPLCSSGIDYLRSTASLVPRIAQALRITVVCLG
jgi:hypothetical protein